MPNCSEGAISAIVADSAITIRPCDDGSRNVVGTHKEDWNIVDHFINAAIPLRHISA
jgi:hypothetical protein